VRPLKDSELAELSEAMRLLGGAHQEAVPA
jgi:hypothetical protein